MRVPLSLVHLLLELLRLFFVREAQACETVLQLEGVKEGPVLIVAPRIVYLLIPYHAAIRRRDIDQLDPEGVTNEIICQDGGSL